MKPLIVISAYQFVDWRLQDAIARAGIPVIAVYGCSDLVKVRSQILSDALRSTADRFIFVDSDIVPTAEQLRALAESERLDPANAVAGCYLSREGQLAAQLRTQEPFRLDECDTFLECFAAGMGFSAVHRETVERMRDQLPELRTESNVEWRAYFLPMVLADEEMTSGNETYFSEDWAFWWRVRKLGAATLWLDTTLVVGHVQSKAFTPHANLLVKPHGRGTQGLTGIDQTRAPAPVRQTRN